MWSMRAVTSVAALSAHVSAATAPWTARCRPAKRLHRKGWRARVQNYAPELVKNRPRLCKVQVVPLPGTGLETAQSYPQKRVQDCTREKSCTFAPRGDAN